MALVLPRTNLHSSNLIRCLADLGIVDVVDPGSAFAERLGHWIHFADAITLSSVHGDTGSAASGSSLKPQSAARDASMIEFERIQTILVNSITKSFGRNPGKAHITLPVPQLELPLNLTAAYVPYRRFYEAHQRDMELTIQPLRFNVRDALGKASPRLRKLAELDAVLERILRDRESKLLSRVPVLLKKRFERLFKEYQQKLVDSQQADNPAAWVQAGGWLTQFCSDMQMLLLAEVEFRLQPAMGLIEAFNQDTQ